MIALHHSIIFNQSSVVLFIFFLIFSILFVRDEFSYDQYLAFFSRFNFFRSFSFTLPLSGSYSDFLSACLSSSGLLCVFLICYDVVWKCQFLVNCRCVYVRWFVIRWKFCTNLTLLLLNIQKNVIGKIKQKMLRR